MLNSYFNLQMFLWVYKQENNVYLTLWDIKSSTSFQETFQLIKHNLKHSSGYNGRTGLKYTLFKTLPYFCIDSTYE